MAVLTSAQAFMQRVEQRPDGCWIWSGVRVQGAGQFTYQGRTVSARRFAYEQWAGPIPGRRLVFVDCGEPWCVNPEHLYVSDPAERFWRQVQKGEGCWEWTGALNAYGYGVIHLGGGRGLVPAHRYSYELHHGAAPADLMICHHCDNKRCVRPDHLYAGTAADNSRDAVERGQVAVGERHGQSVLTDEQACEIRRRLDDGEVAASLAREFGVGDTTIHRIRHRRGWTHV